MAKIFSRIEENKKPHINKQSIVKFFLERARKIDTVGPVRAVIYQDKHPDLAEKRDAAEKARLLPLLEITDSHRILDIGCGTGRWTQVLTTGCAYYHGIDFSPELIQYARQIYPESDRLRFSIASAENFSLISLGESKPFERILCCGVMIYLNDDEVINSFRCMAASAAPKSRIVLREPVGIDQRLTIKDHLSDELEQSYNAIYRTQDEIEKYLAITLISSEFKLVAQGNVYGTQLNNRTETIQRWFVLERT